MQRSDALVHIVVALLRSGLYTPRITVETADMFSYDQLAEHASMLLAKLDKVPNA